jgi:hypothetical protein
MRILSNSTTSSSSYSLFTLPSDEYPPLEVTYSTRSGVVVSINSVNGTVRFTSAPKRGGESNYLFGRGSGNLLMPTKNIITTQELIVKKRKLCDEFVKKTVFTATEKAKEYLKLYKEGNVVFGKQKPIPLKNDESSIQGITSLTTSKSSKKEKEKVKEKVTKSGNLSLSSPVENESKQITEEDFSDITPDEAEVYRIGYVNVINSLLSKTNTFHSSSLSNLNIPIASSKSSQNISSKTSLELLSGFWDEFSRNSVWNLGCVSEISSETIPFEVERLVQGLYIILYIFDLFFLYIFFF